MAEMTKEVRTIMFSVVGETVVTHRLPFNANDPIGRLKLEKFLAQGFTFDDPRLRVSTGKPEVLVTQEVDLSQSIDGAAALETTQVEGMPIPEVKEAIQPPVRHRKKETQPRKKRRQLSKGVGNG